MRRFLGIGLLVLFVIFSYCGCKLHADPIEAIVNVSFTATGDDGNTGTAAFYDLRYSKSMITSANWESASKIDSVLLPKPSIAGTKESFNVTILADSETKYYFALKVYDEMRNCMGISNVAEWTSEDYVPPAAVTDLKIGG